MEAACDIRHVLLLEDQGDGARGGIGVDEDVAALAFIEHHEGGGRNTVMTALGADSVLILQRIAQRQGADKGLYSGTKLAAGKEILAHQSLVRPLYWRRVFIHTHHAQIVHLQRFNLKSV